jgi:ATP-binding cassette subfamily A (ABC1) protein 1
MALSGVLYLGATIGIDAVLSNPSFMARVGSDPQVPDGPGGIDQDVDAEMRRVKSGEADGDMILLKGLRKVYPPGSASKAKAKVAVKDLSFGVPQGECFGFLGINGAGKTSTLKMLTGSIAPTKGLACLGGFDLLVEPAECFALIGYCPQCDALLDLLTTREHLELFARIKGVPESVVDALVMEKLRQLDLTSLEHKLAGTLSGGNKRKLSVAVSLIGSPPIVFLDEPSTGMDPVARRFMWDVIASVSTGRRDCSIILTTHSMEECEALCTRIGIMVGGQLQCLGSKQHLKSRFGEGLQLEVKLRQPSDDDIGQLARKCTHVFSESRSSLGHLLAQPVKRANLGAVFAEWGRETRLDAINPTHDFGPTINHGLAREGVSLQSLCSWWLSENAAAKLHHFFAVVHFPGSELLEQQCGGHYRYMLVVGDRQLGEVFSLIEKCKQDLYIQEYSVSQTSLEQIFNRFASQQKEETRRGSWDALAKGATTNPLNN